MKRLPGKLIDAQVVLEAFGTTVARHSVRASQFGSLLDIHFNEHGHVSGGHVQYVNFNNGVVTNCSKSEQNYNVFSYLLYGATGPEKNQCYLQASSSYNYLGSRSGEQLLKGRAEEKWSVLHASLLSLGFKQGVILQIMQILSAILLLGNLIIADDTMAKGSVGVAIRNTTVLTNIADLLGTDESDLQDMLRYRTKLIQNDLTSKILTWKEATQQRHCLAATLYELLFEYIVNQTNKKLTPTHHMNSIALLDIPSMQTSGEDECYKFSLNYMNERLFDFRQKRIFCLFEDEYREEGIQSLQVNYHNNVDRLELYSTQNGMFPILNTHYESKSMVIQIEKRLKVLQKDSQNLRVLSTHEFTIRHYSEKISYSIEKLYDGNHRVDLCEEFAPVFCEGQNRAASKNALLAQLFSPYLKGVSQAKVDTGMNDFDPMAFAEQNKSVGGKEDPKIAKISPTTACERLKQQTDSLFMKLENYTAWTVICLRSNDWGIEDSCDIKALAAQLREQDVCNIVKKASFHHTVTYLADEFCEHFSQALDLAKANPDMSFVEKCETLEEDREWDESHILIGTNRVRNYHSSQVGEHAKCTQSRLSRCSCQMMLGEYWKTIFVVKKSLSIVDYDKRLQVRASLPPLNKISIQCNTLTPCIYLGTGINERQIASMRPLSDTFSVSDAYNDGSERDDSQDGSDMESSSQPPRLTGKPKKKRLRPTNLSRTRQLWLVITWAITWWIPGSLLGWIGRMKRPDVRIAWREKFSLCFLIFLLSAAMVWFIAFFSHIICPVKHIYSQYELQSKTSSADAIVSIRGEVFDLGKFAPRHWASEIIPNMALIQYAGQDVSHLFPVQVSALCEGAQEPVSLAMHLDNYVGLTDPNAKYHDFRYSSGDYRPDWYFEKMTYLRKNYRLGYMGYDISDVRHQANNPRQFGGITSTRKWAILNGDIYDLTFYFMGGRSIRGRANETIPEDIEVNFIDTTIAQLFKLLAGTDITELFNQLPLDHSLRERQLTCLRNLFLVGKVDTRNSPQCVFSEYLLLIISGFLCSVILFKFVAALQVTQSSGDIEYSNFIVCQVPCYTEGEESIRKTLNSIATLRYDDKRKLLFIITDGMLVGSGNEKSTPRIVLDILGVDESIDREALYYNAVGEGYKQHNMAKVYSGLYEYAGHAVPYIVVVKVGNLSERQKPGNRGKRDSQMVLLQFLNKVHYQSDMNPLEFEIYHQIQNVIGVNPFFYEYVMMVDADTEVMPDSLNNLVSSFINDDKIVGMCGETMLSNEKDTWVTMIQVYEYYISHFLSKAFESLFGTVTCLPGCFCMYRIRSVGKNQALLVSNVVMLEYGDIKVDTLHKKNLLHLGEDRYLTTLILKHFPTYKTKFNPNAACLTSAPDSWSVLVSQRRRWINSTIHNLGELIFLPQMCGFCCFSMRFVVILDLLSTLVMPAVVCYLGYLIYEISTHSSQVPLMSLITLASVYGLQAFIFIVRRKVRSRLGCECE